MSQIISHSTMIESKSVNKGRRTQDFIAKACNLHLTQTLSTLLLIRLDLARMPAKKKGHHLGAASLQLLGFTHPNLNERNPPGKVWLPTPHTVTRSLSSSTRCWFHPRVKYVKHVGINHIQDWRTVAPLGNVHVSCTRAHERFIYTNQSESL